MGRKVRIFNMHSYKSCWLDDCIVRNKLVQGKEVQIKKLLNQTFG